MLIKVCLLLLCVGAYASYTDAPKVTTEDKLFEELGVFPENFLLKFPKEADFFRTKIIVYLFFNLFSKYFADKDPFRFWKKFNVNDFNRITIDAAFYEYLTEFTDRRLKHLLFDPLERSKRSHEDMAIDRIGEYLDNLSAAEVSDDQSETSSEGSNHSSKVCVIVPLRDPSFGIAGKDYPNYCDIPKTSFTCANKPIPGVYADIETGCQVFHACWPNRIDSFLCPIGAIFNQALLTCDFWYESKCPSLPTDPSLLAKGKTPKSRKPGVSKGSPLRESLSSTFESVAIPNYDGTCRSLMTEPLQLRMKFLPAKCQVRKMTPSTPMTASKTSKYDKKRLENLANVFSVVIKNALAFIMKAVNIGTSDLKRNQEVEKLPGLNLDKPILKPRSGKSEVATEFTSTRGEMDTSEDGRSASTTEFPSENFPTRMNSKFTAKPTSQDKINAGHAVKSTPLKASKLLEDSKKHALDVVTGTLEFSGKVLSDFFPFMEKMLLDSQRKSPKPKNS